MTIFKKKATDIQETKKAEQQWEEIQSKHNTALIAYIWYEAPEEEQNFAMVRKASVLTAQWSLSVRWHLE